MKRIAIFALPLLATMIAVGIGLVLVRTQGAALKPRVKEARTAIAEAIGEVAETLEEAIE